MAEHERKARASEQEPAGDPQATANEADLDQLRALLEETQTLVDQQRQTADEYLNMLQRVQADFLNYKRRVEAEQEARADAARAEVIRAFLPIVDDLERALDHVPSEVAEQSWAEGFGLIRRNLASAFERLGVQRVGAEGDVFDPNLHEAVAYEEHQSQPEGHVATVLRPGYQLGDRIVRAAQVSVARSPAQQPADEAWSTHQPRGGHGNGGVDRSDLGKPRHIERA